MKSKVRKCLPQYSDNIELCVENGDLVLIGSSKVIELHQSLGNIDRRHFALIIEKIGERYEITKNRIGLLP